MAATVSGCHFSGLTNKFYGAWWARIATRRCFSGFMVYKRNSCSTSLACLFSDWTRFSPKNRACFGSIGIRLWREPVTFPLYCEGKMMKTIFPQNYVYVLRTTTTRHMVSFINFYFHFLANFQTKTSPHMFSIFTYVMSCVTHSEPGLPMMFI